MYTSTYWIIILALLGGAVYFLVLRCQKQRYVEKLDEEVQFFYDFFSINGTHSVEVKYYMYAGGVDYELGIKHLRCVTLQKIEGHSEGRQCWTKIPTLDKRELLPEVKYSAIKKWQKEEKNSN